MTPDPSDDERVAGVVIDTETGRHFVPAENALSALDNPRLSAVPGTHLQMLWFEGRVVPAAAWTLLVDGEGATAERRDERDSQAPVDRISEAPPDRPSDAGDALGVRSSRAVESALVCEVDGHPLALVGVTAVASGRFEPAEQEAVRFRGERVPRADLPALYRAALAQSHRRDESRDAPPVPGDSREDDPAKRDE